MNKKTIIATLLGATVIGATLSGFIVIPKNLEENLEYSKKKDVVIASVGKEKLTLKDIDNLNNPVMDEVKKLYGDNFEEELNKKINESTGEEKKKYEVEKEYIINQREKIAEGFITKKTMSLKAQNLNLISEEEVNKKEKEWNKIYESLDVDSNKVLKDEIYALELYKKMMKEVKVTRKETREYYKNNIDKYTKKPGITIDEVFVPNVNEYNVNANELSEEIFHQMGESELSHYEMEEIAKQNPEKFAAAKFNFNKFVDINNNNENKQYIESLVEIHDREGSTGTYRIWGTDGVYVTRVLNYVKNGETSSYEEEKIFIEHELKQDKFMDNLKFSMKKWTNESNVKYKKNLLSF